MRIREIVVLRGAVNSEDALQAALPTPWSIIYVQDMLRAAVCEANFPDDVSPEAMRTTLNRALVNARKLAHAA